jgi:hypothetical protein
MIEIAKEALELAVRASEYGEELEAIVGRARAFYEFLRAPVGACVQQPELNRDPNTYATLGDVYASSGKLTTQSALNNHGPIGTPLDASCCGIVEKYRNS